MVKKALIVKILLLHEIAIVENGEDLKKQLIVKIEKQVCFL